MNYADGYIQAVMDFADLLDYKGNTPEAVHDYMLDFWRFKLQHLTEDDAIPTISIIKVEGDKNDG